MNDNTVSSYLSKEVLDYEPTKEEIKFYHKNNLKSLRYIFCGKELDDFEKQKIRELKEFVNKLKLKEKEKEKDKEKEKEVETYETIFKNTLFDDDNYVLRFLQGNEFVYERCYNDMLRHLTWRKENLPIPLSDVQNFLDKGYCYIHGRDKQMHPIIIINCKNIISANTKDVLKVFYYWLEFCISKLLIEGKVEQWRVIIDLTSCSVLNIPIATLKDISKNLSCNYRSRLCKMLVLSAPLVVTGIWHMLKSIIPVVTQQKITITSSEKEKKLLDHVQANQLEKKFGGSCENATVFTEPILP
ncbi:CRAL/TRIO domain-containing protein, putative [Plasmodium sp. DRC-Itaito]|nr:CRAL/TRIO domain-containing protein, putative [Plasmodium sp. DRC-Itaito]